MELAKCGLKAGIYDNLQGAKELLAASEDTIVMNCIDGECQLQLGLKLYKGHSFNVCFRRLMEDNKNV